MPEPAPTSLAGTCYATYNRLTWNNEDSYDEIEVYRKASTESTWSPLAILNPAVELYDDYAVTNTNIRLQYHVIGAKSPFVDSDPSNQVDLTRWGDTISDTATVTDSVVGLQTYVDIITDTVGVATYPDSETTWVSAITDTVTVTDSFTDAVSIKTTFDYYIGMYNGTVHATRSSYLSDNTTSITSIWETIETDLGMPNKFKTVHRANLKFVDKSSTTPVSVSISNDGGLTWTGASKSVGTGNDRTDSKWFYYNMSGEYFKFKVELASADKEFQIIALDIDFLPCGEVIEV
jgi:hypothetical protein